MYKMIHLTKQMVSAFQDEKTTVEAKTEHEAAGYVILLPAEYPAPHALRADAEILITVRQ